MGTQPTGASGDDRRTEVTDSEGVTIGNGNTQFNIWRRKILLLMVVPIITGGAAAVIILLPRKRRG